MKLKKAVKLLQDSKFYIKGVFLSSFGEDADAEYTLRHIDEKHTLRPVTVRYNLKVIDAKTLLKDVGLYSHDLKKITTKVELLNEVEEGLCNIILEIDSAGVERF